MRQCSLVFISVITYTYKEAVGESFSTMTGVNKVLMKPIGQTPRQLCVLDPSLTAVSHLSEIKCSYVSSLDYTFLQLYLLRCFKHNLTLFLWFQLSAIHK